MLNLSSHQRRKDLQAAFQKIAPDSILEVQDQFESFLSEIEEDVDLRADPGPHIKNQDENILDDLRLKEFDLLDVVMAKFNMAKS